MTEILEALDPLRLLLYSPRREQRPSCEINLCLFRLFAYVQCESER